MTRKEANMEIVRLLVNVINMYPDLRFGQVLQVTNVLKLQKDVILARPYLSDNFYEESEETLKRMKERISEYDALSQK